MTERTSENVIVCVLELPVTVKAKGELPKKGSVVMTGVNAELVAEKTGSFR